MRVCVEIEDLGAILGALSHKLLRILIGLLRHQTDFDPNWSPTKYS